MKITPQLGMNALALILLGLLAGLLVFQPVPEANLQLLGTIIGALAGFLVGAGNAPAIASRLGWTPAGEPHEPGGHP